MTELAILRHAPTVWNEEKRLQGRADIALSEAGRQAARNWRLPKDISGWDLVASPLQRARETAVILTGRTPAIDHRLLEMDMGAWEGQRLVDLRADLGEEMRRNEARGRDYQPQGGESPRQVMSRLRPFLAECALRGHPRVAVAHKGILRALYAMAAGWTMESDPADKLKDACYHRFLVQPCGALTIENLNIPLVQQ